MKNLLLLFALLLLLCGCHAAADESLAESSAASSIEQESVADQTSSAPSEESSDDDVSFDISVPMQEESGDVSHDTETPGEAMDGRFGEYCFVHEEDGKKTVTIYSHEQISDFAERRENGEWFSLTSEEIEYLINDTKALFENYDVIRVRSLDGSISTYYGLPFYGSEDYYACFGGFDLGEVDKAYSFDFKAEMLWAMYKRIEVLNSACAVARTGMDAEHHDRIVLSDTSYMSESELDELAEYFHKVYVLDGTSTAFSDTTGDVYYFKAVGEDRRLNRAENISKDENAKVTTFLSDDFGYGQVGHIKYDKLCPNVVIELWSEETQNLVARIRIDEQNHPELIAELRTRCQDFFIAQDDEYQPPTHNYRVGVYLNGFTVPVAGGDYCDDIAFMYYPEGNIDQYCLIMGNPVFFDRTGNGDYFLGNYGCKSISEFVNRLLMDMLSEE